MERGRGARKAGSGQQPNVERGERRGERGVEACWKANGIMTSTTYDIGQSCRPVTQD